MQKEQLIEFLKSELAQLGYELIDMQLNVLKNKTILRVFVDKLGEKSVKCSVNISECESISRSLEAVIDVKGFFNSYVLEVSTPGIERKLNNISDFKRFKNCLASVKLFEDYKDLGQHFIGKIIDVPSKDLVIFEFSDKQFEIGYNKIKKAKLKYER